MKNRKPKTGNAKPTKVHRFHVSGCLFPVLHFFALMRKTIAV